jgi:alkanesulfonate monooxygenase SsuD/methylene tetrahydromethanopterin reductase-like flavin-dependent oxidoreductase (luciferase family)
LAAITDTIDLGPLVSCVGFHPPALLAKMAAGIDEVSSGRFIFGVGAGWNQPEFDAFGIPFDQRGARFEEAFTILRTLCSGERCTFAGTFNTANDSVFLPRAHPPIPIMIDPISEPSVRALAEALR